VTLPSRADERDPVLSDDEMAARVTALLAVGRAWREEWAIQRDVVGRIFPAEEAWAVTSSIRRLATQGAVIVRGRGRETRIALSSRASEDDGWRTHNDRIPAHSTPVPAEIYTPELVSRLLEAIVRDEAHQANVYWLPAGEPSDVHGPRLGRCRAAVMDEQGRVVRRRYWDDGRWKVASR
jgi:hypothetical protein